LPQGWAWARLGRAAAINPETVFEDVSADTELTFVPMAAVAEETGRIDLRLRRPAREVAKGYVRFQEGDVIFAKITPCMENGKAAPVPPLTKRFARAQPSSMCCDRSSRNSGISGIGL